VSDQHFPAGTVVSAFIEAERALSEILRVVPYCPEHQDVWSPRLGEMLLYLCSQLDSLWRQEIPCAKPRKHLNMTDYSGHFAGSLCGKFVVFWGDIEGGTILAPFQEWEVGSNSSPLWWTAYNKVKHDCLANRKLGSLKNVCRAMAGLFVAILRSKLCLSHVLATDWLALDVYAPENIAPHLANDTEWTEAGIKVESHLFSYVVGTCLDLEIPGGFPSKYMGSSYRLRDWLGRNMGKRVRDVIE